jgi:hypothetical protein
MDGAEFSMTRFALRLDDRLVLVSDGLAEARNPEGQLFGFARVQQLVLAGSCSPIPHVPLYQANGVGGSDYILAQALAHPTDNQRKIPDPVLVAIDIHDIALSCSENQNLHAEPPRSHKPKFGTAEFQPAK